MKFAKTFPSQQVPQWSQYYVNYRSLKKLIKEIVAAQEALFAKQQELENSKLLENQDGPRNRRDVGNAEDNYLDDEHVRSLVDQFMDIIDKEVEKVDTFYRHQYMDKERKLQRLIFLVIQMTDSMQTNFTLPSGLQVELPIIKSEVSSENVPEELDDLRNNLLEVQSAFRNLLWYGEMNKRALLKILKKLDKKVGTEKRQHYTESVIWKRQFANDEKTNSCLSTVKDDLSIVADKIDQVARHMESLHQAESIQNSHPHHRKSTDVLAKFPRFQSSIEADDGAQLIEDLKGEYTSVLLIPTNILIQLLEKTAFSNARNCIDHLLKIISALGDPNDLNHRNFFHFYVISFGKSLRGYSSANLNKLQNLESNSTAADDDIPYRSFVYILDQLPSHLRVYLIQTDCYKRTPLHYASQYGLTRIVSSIIEKLRTWDAWDPTISTDDIKKWGDSDAQTPLHLAIKGNHAPVVRTLLSHVNLEAAKKSSHLLHLAVRLNSIPLLQALLSVPGLDINFADSETGETALYLASKLKFFQVVQYLLKEGADTEAKEVLFGWTAIFVAAAEGFEEITSLLLENNAQVTLFDKSGWTPLEHAVLRGHLDIAKLLDAKSHTSMENIQSPKANRALLHKSSLINESSEKLSKLEESTNSTLYPYTLAPTPVISPSPSSVSDKSVKQLKFFGHKHLANDEAVLILALGGHDSRSSTSALSITSGAFWNGTASEFNGSMSLVITCVDALEDGTAIVDLPLDLSADSIKFKVPNKSNHSYIVYFDLISNHTTNNTNPSFVCLDKSIGRATALVSKAGALVGVNRHSLSDVVTIPIISREKLEVLGRLNFEYLIATPFEHAQMMFKHTDTYWKSLVSTRVIGHRGLGKNLPNKRSLQLGENTVESFIAAASLGASYVEFDVQLTKDNIPVIYHDFLVAETGVDIPMHQLTLEQFLNLNDIGRHFQKNTADRRRNSVDDTDLVHTKRPWTSNDERSGYHGNRDDINGYSPKYHLGFNHDHMQQLLNERMKLTRAYKKNSFKGNTRGHSIASSFVTLAELFKKIPHNVGFNIECKYPMIDEAEEEDTGNIAIEMNHWVDTVLKVVYDNAKGRDIIFSSFHPDICVLLSLKQPSFPILFLTEGGAQKMADLRASSLQNAIRFARTWNLLGIVTAAEPIIQAPRLAQVIKSSGLVCVTYGVENNDPENVAKEMEAGVDAVIVDSVLAIRKGLTKDTEYR